MNPKITGHEFGGAGESLEIQPIDEATFGANHEYRLLDVFVPKRRKFLDKICFQKGPVAQTGINGVTEGALLAIVADRLRSFQAGPFSSRENALALTKIEEALHWLEARTRNRTERGVEGTLQK